MSDNILIKNQETNKIYLKNEAPMKESNFDEIGHLEDINEKEVLLKSIKKHVKLLMEEYVNKRYVQEHSSNVLALCATIESCLLLGLKRRALGLFKESSSLALLEKISKQNASAKLVYTIVIEERSRCCNSQSDTSYFSSNANSSVSSRSDYSNGSTFGNSWSTSSFLGMNNNKIFSSNNQSAENEITNLHHRNLQRYYWIRLALTEKVLDRIVDFLVKNSGFRYFWMSRRYYNKGSIIGDPCDGYILVSLLSGPCSLEYTRVKDPELITEEPDAVELFQRQRIHNNYSNTGVEVGKSPNLKHVMSTSSLFWSSGSNQFLNRPILVSRQRIHSIEKGDNAFSANKSPFCTPKHYVESLHQSENLTLLFGKNNVYSQPRDDMDKIPGYLSLHLAVSELLLKWTPNELMNTNIEEPETKEKSQRIEWDCAMLIWINKIVYIHCHRHVQRGDTLVLVNRDGSQIPPFDFPEGGHLMSFLSCLEKGLLPKCRLDPPVWHQDSENNSTNLIDKDMEKEYPKSAGFITPKSEKKMIFIWSSMENNNSKFNWFHQPFNNKLTLSNCKVLSEPIEQLSCHHTHKTNQKTLDDFSTDLVFRIVRPKQNFSGELYNDTGNEFDDNDPRSKSVQSSLILSTPYESNTEVIPQWSSKYTDGAMKKRFRVNKDEKVVKSSIRRLCSSMKKEILARAFYGWLGYCRHMKTIRSHLNQLVLPPNSSITVENKFKEKLDKDAWISSLNDDKQIINSLEIQQRVYYSGCDPSLRVEIWPFLLNVYKWNSTFEEREICLKRWRKRYELAVSDWMIIETVIDEQNNEDKDISTQFEDDCVIEIEREHQQFNEDEKDCILQSKDSQKKGKKVMVTKKVLNIMKQNLNRIDKDVARCDRNFSFFDQTEKGESNLDVLQRIMCTWVWENLELGYIQGMCDLLAPLVVIFQGNEELTFACFTKYMDKMMDNFPASDNSKMDLSFSRMRSAVQILDSDLLEHMQSFGDFTHFYFSYRWFLLDFKREFSYNDVFSLWETIWAAEEISSTNFSLFIGLSLLLSYRDLIIDNRMEFTDIIRFFNEMAEHHNTPKILEFARELVEKLQQLLHS